MHAEKFSACNKANRRRRHAGKMSEEEGEISALGNEQDSKAQQNGNSETTNGDQPSTREAKELSLDKENDTEPRKVQDANALKNSTTPEQFTYEYRTHEAPPMTIFYRSENSQFHAAKQRPTLQELRKGLENDKVGKTCMLSF